MSFIAKTGQTSAETSGGVNIWMVNYLSDGVTLLCSALGLAGWVAEGENDWALVERGHVSDDLLGEGSGHSGHSWDTKQQRRTTQGCCDDNIQKFRSVQFAHRKGKGQRITHAFEEKRGNLNFLPIPNLSVEGLDCRKDCSSTISSSSI